MSVAVRKSSPEVIRPPEPVTTTTATRTIKLTSFDRVGVKLPETVLLVFERLDHEANEKIKKALSQALVHYHPFAGRIVSSGANGEEFSISCTGKGVEFITASADCSLQEAKIFGELPGTKAMLDELAVFYPDGSYGFDDPLLSVQVTEFTCGGLILGVTWNHGVADGAGIAQFLAAVGELARGSPSPSIVPVRCDTAVSSFPPLTYPLVQVILACPDTSDMELIVPLNITIPSSLINHIKAKYHNSFEGQQCTTFEIVLAILWRCRVRAAMSNDQESPICLAFTMNMRKVVGAKNGYYGNCITTQVLTVATSGMVAEASIMDLIKMIKRAKDKDMVRNGSGEDDDDQMLRRVGGRYDVMLVTSWKNIGFEQVDFGSGAPARVMSHTRQGAPGVPICMVYPTCKGKDGVNLLLLAVKEEHADAFLGELEHVVI